jgi:hypothetical protein
MFMNWLKHALTKPQDLYTNNDYKLISSGILAICIIFIQYLISVEKPDWLQTSSLALFSIAIPFLAFYIFIAQTMVKPKLPISAYLAISLEATFRIGLFCTYFGISSALAHSSMIVANVFVISCVFMIYMVALIKKDRFKAQIREIKSNELKIEKLKIELNESQLELEKSENELIQRLLKQGKAEFELRKLELEQDTTIKP